jgi:hypothetical protein
MEFIDSELLILEVQKHPCIYDMNSEQYKYRHMKVTASLSSALTDSRIAVFVLQMVSSTRDKSILNELIVIL